MPHIHDLIDLTVTVYIVNGNAVLLRKHDKYNMWLGVGGHVELHEDCNQAAIREVKEEVGLDIMLSDTHMITHYTSEDSKILIPPIFMNIHHINSTHQHMDMIYFATSESRAVVPGEGDRSEEWKWFTKDELVDVRYGIRKVISFEAAKALEVLGK